MHTHTKKERYQGILCQLYRKQLQEKEKKKKNNARRIDCKFHSNILKYNYSKNGYVSKYHFKKQKNDNNALIQLSSQVKPKFIINNIHVFFNLTLIHV